MKKVLLSMLFLAFGFVAVAQKKLPSVDIKDMNGKTVNTASLVSDKPVVISFWATWCKPCQRELDAINEMYEEWNEETGVELYAISIDDARAASRVKPLVNGKAWEFNVLLDKNQDFKRAMNVGSIPHTFVVNSKGEIVYSHNGYSDGDEDELVEEVEKLLK
ncbi:MAG: TlpA family protein disulfide reductase [Flavobacteriales bacterium]|nr:TlpA family protein disulfide reductase [Flavobacteriales bacterium]